MFPEGWKEKTVGELVSFSGGSQPPKGTFEYALHDGYVRLIQTRDYKTNKYATYVPIDKAKKFCEANDVMIGRYGPPVFQIYRGLKGAYNVALIKATPKKGISKEYLFYFLSQGNLFRQIDQLSQRSSGQTGVDMDFLKSYRFPLPPPNEVLRIAEILSTWDEGIEGVRALVAAKLQQKKALMQQLLTGKKRLPGFGGEWKAFDIGTLFKTVSRPVDWDDDAVYSLLSVRRRSGGVFLRDKLRGDQIKTKTMYTAKAGDFLISKMQVLHGATGLVPDDLDGCHISGSYIALRPVDPDAIDMNFFSRFSCTPLFYHLTYLSSYGVHIEKMTFNLDWFMKATITIPADVEEQQVIADVLSTADEEIDSLDAKLSALQEQKKGLMQKLLTGQVRVKV